MSSPDSQREKSRAKELQASIAYLAAMIAQMRASDLSAEEREAIEQLIATLTNVLR